MVPHRADRAAAPSPGFPPAARPDATVLLLGSLPGGESLRQRRYYANPRNHFWSILGELTGATLDLGYEERLRRLAEAGIALWDVCASAVRPGSLDTAIVRRSVTVNDFAGFFSAHPYIRLVAANGGAAATLYRRLVLPTLSAPAAAIPFLALPSTSPAHTRSREEKLGRWREALQPALDARAASR